MTLLDILKHCADPDSPPDDRVFDRFDQAAQQAPREDLGRGIAAAFRADSTPSFGDTVGSLFNRSSPQQRAGVLNEILQSIPSGALAGVAGGVLGKLLGANVSTSATRPTLTPAQASQVSPSDVTAIATHAEAQDGSIVDQVGAFYAQHPDLVKSLGAAALAIALGHIRTHQ